MKIAPFVLLGLATLLPGRLASADGWPRTTTTPDGYTVTLYQPQIDAWDDPTVLDFRLALALTPPGGKDPTYGTLTGRASSHVNWQDRSVLLGSPTYTEAKFPAVPADQAATYAGVVAQVLPNGTSHEVPLDLILADVDRTKAQDRAVEVNLDPPPIYHANGPAILVGCLGSPVLQPVPGTKLLWVTNTNWPLFLQEGSPSAYYLLDHDGWLTAPDLEKGPWAPATALPPDLARLPDDGNWARVKANVPGTPVSPVPQVFVATRPAELLVTKGDPQLVPVPGTSLYYVSNTDRDVFLDVANGTYYFLTSGRWFSASDLGGPWAAATKSLPADFRKIPIDSPKADVLASVPGSPQAQEAVLQASIPHVAQVDPAKTRLVVRYDGAPDFQPIPGSQGVSAARNTTYAVFQVGSAYYCCSDGVWFRADAPQGAWAVARYVPSEIYTIPSSSPYHNVTYVYVYGASTDESGTATTGPVTVGYTAGYTGAVVAGGLLMFGAGYWLGADEVWSPYATWHYPPSWYAYGTAAHYSYYHGGYVGGAAYYGPYGGAGYAARYNPATGTYARGAAAYGPAGAVGTAAAYNPWSGRGAMTSQAATAYGTWGRSVVSDGDDWARFGHASTPWGSTAGWQTSAGGAGAVHAGAAGTSSVARTASGNVYAGHDGNVYRYDPSASSWQQHTASGWNDTGWKGAGAEQQATHPSTWGASASTGGATHQALDSDAWGRSWGAARSNGLGGGDGGGGWGGWGGGGFGRTPGDGGGDRFGGGWGGGGWGGDRLGGGGTWGGGDRFGGGGGRWGGGGGGRWGGGGGRRR